ncbi:hypothetical protein Tco_0707357 [Tanacetum coccineum]|uniref:Uncharacterized protein n=1 Tax=Tanacetum coccineum TaxID=301880 RepID=A0ABQ4YA32_9ASTR
MMSSFLSIKYEHVALNLDLSLSNSCDHRDYLHERVSDNQQVFAVVLAVLITRASQSRQHSKSEPEKYGSKTGCWLVLVLAGRLGKGLYTLGCDRGRLKMIKVTTLAEFMILSGAENRPPMLDKDLYDSWKSRMELYMQNKEHGRMILESVEHGPLIWPMIKENCVTRTKKYEELSATEKIQADCDLKANNIILQGLLYDVYSLVNHHRVAKDLRERIQLLMQGTSLTKQEKGV